MLQPRPQSKKMAKTRRAGSSCHAAETLSRNFFPIRAGSSSMDDWGAICGLMTIPISFELFTGSDRQFPCPIVGILGYFFGTKISLSFSVIGAGSEYDYPQAGRVFQRLFNGFGVILTIKQSLPRFTILCTTYTRVEELFGKALTSRKRTLSTWPSRACYRFGE
jgi:hypothetical protein